MKFLPVAGFDWVENLPSPRQQQFALPTALWHAVVFPPADVTNPPILAVRCFYLPGLLLFYVGICGRAINHQLIDSTTLQSCPIASFGDTGHWRISSTTTILRSTPSQPGQQSLRAHPSPRKFCVPTGPTRSDDYIPLGVAWQQPNCYLLRPSQCLLPTWILHQLHPWQVHQPPVDCQPLLHPRTRSQLQIK
jgi:hypothetical protein